VTRDVSLEQLVAFPRAKYIPPNNRFSWRWYFSPSFESSRRTSRAGTFPQRNLLPPKVTPIPPVMNAGVLFSRTQLGVQVALLKVDLQSALWIGQ
jgi:hypothetical protein